MRLFLDTSVLLAACGSAQGSSRALVQYAPAQGWELLASPWVVAEVLRNLVKFPVAVTAEWLRLRRQLVIVDDVVSLDRALVFSVSKDRPVLLSALASAQVLLTLDREDFMGVLGNQCYGLPILLPYDFLERERAAGRLPRP
ncbi:MAG: PIN domain-containing protein [Chthoniobacteraceae bacterium]